MEFTKDTKNLATGFALALIIIMLAALLASTARADGPSAENYADLKIAKENQEILGETREAHNKFMQAKTGNETISARLAKDGYKINWSNMTLEPSFE